MLSSLNFFLISFVVICSGTTNIEKYFKICNRNSPDVNDCLVEAVQHGVDAMSNGIKDLGIPPIDPYFQKEQRFEYKNNQIRANMLVTDAYISGLKLSTVRDARVRADEDSFHLEIDMLSPLVSVSGKFSGTGSYNALNITAYGSFINNMTDLVYTWKLDGKPETIGNEVFVKITSFYMRPDISKMHIYLNNEAPDSKDLTDFGVKLVNENWRLLYKELLPFAQATWNKIGIKIANKIFMKVPYSKLFPV